MTSKLTAIFMAVFPSLSINAIFSASEDTVEEWDSITAVALLITVEKEFMIRIPTEMISNLTSFAKYTQYLEGK